MIGYIRVCEPQRARRWPLSRWAAFAVFVLGLAMGGAIVWIWKL